MGEGRRGLLPLEGEGGHVTLPVRTEGDLALMHHVEKVHGFAGVEDVLSGRGLERLAAVHGPLGASVTGPKEGVNA